MTNFFHLDYLGGLTLLQMSIDLIGDIIPSLHNAVKLWREYDPVNNDDDMHFFLLLSENFLLLNLNWMHNIYDYQMVPH